MKLKVLDTAHHRNGVADTPFDVVLFKVLRERGTKVGILFGDPGSCAVLDITMLASGDIAFGSNSWRGDEYEPALRRARGEVHDDSELTVIEHSTRRFGAALRTYSDLNSTSENVIDLLTDVRHWCDRSGEDFARLDRQAYQHYLAEITPPEKANSKNHPVMPQHDPARYRYESGKDGCHETWDIYTPDGRLLVSIPFCDEIELTEAAAALIVHRLNLHHELRDALEDLLAQTVDMDIKYGIGLSEGEEEARERALSVLAKTPNQEA